MRHRLICFMFIGGGLLASPSLWAAGPTPAMLSNTCAGCHGTNGASAGPSMPTLGGQTPAYIVASMKKFKSGERPSTIMGRLAKGYSDDEFAAMGEFFSQQKFLRQKQETDVAKVSRGKELHEQRCKKCHQEGGRESEDGGVLAGQWLEYLQITMHDFRSSKRPMDKKMAEKVSGEDKLSDQDVEALLHFYASQQ